MSCRTLRKQEMDGELKMCAVTSAVPWDFTTSRLAFLQQLLNYLSWYWCGWTVMGNMGRGADCLSLMHPETEPGRKVHSRVVYLRVQCQRAGMRAWGLNQKGGVLKARRSH